MRNIYKQVLILLKPILSVLPTIAQADYDFRVYCLRTEFCRGKTSPLARRQIQHTRKPRFVGGVLANQPYSLYSPDVNDPGFRNIDLYGTGRCLC